MKQPYEVGSIPEQLNGKKSLQVPSTLPDSTRQACGRQSWDAEKETPLVLLFPDRYYYYDDGWGGWWQSAGLASGDTIEAPRGL